MKAIFAAALAGLFLSSCADTRYRMVVSVAEQRMVLLDEGCVRMRSVDVAWLCHQVGKGAKVDIVRVPVASAIQ